jgi:hypothetical protein
VAHPRNNSSSLSSAGPWDDAEWNLEISGRRLAARLWRYADGASDDLWLRAARDQGILGSIDHRYNSWLDDYDRLIVVDDPRSIARFLSEPGSKVNLLTEAWRWRETENDVGQEVAGAERQVERAMVLLKRAGLADVDDAGLSRLVLPADPPGRRWWANGLAASRER